MVMISREMVNYNVVLQWPITYNETSQLSTEITYIFGDFLLFLPRSDHANSRFLTIE